MEFFYTFFSIKLFKINYEKCSCIFVKFYLLREVAVVQVLEVSLRSEWESRFKDSAGFEVIGIGDRDRELESRFKGSLCFEVIGIWIRKVSVREFEEVEVGS